MAKTYLSGSFQVMLDRINTSRELLEVFRGQTFSALLRRLKNALKTTSGVLADAEQKEDQVREVKHWHTELKDTFFLAEDILDEISAEALRRKVEAEEGGFGGWFRHRFSGQDHRQMEQKMEEIVRKLEYLARHIEVLGLRELVVPFRNPWPQTSPILAESRVVGRDKDKLAIVNLLISDDVIGNDDLSAIAIVGMPGVGKTTLAQAVYNDDNVKGYFDLRAWICVGEYFDVLKVTKAVLQVISSAPVNIEDLHSLQVELKNRLANKKFLLVLDDVWTENHSDWESFQAALVGRANGSKIVITTCSEIVASIPRTVQQYHLKLLAEEDCWELISRIVLGNRQLDSSYTELEAIGRNIAKQCKGLPLTARSVASHLCSKPTAQEWYDISRDFPRYTSSILPVLKPSYDSLASNLKRCFAFCAIFPKDYVFAKEKLVLLWMAAGLLQQPRSNKRLEDIGNEYLNGLVARSFFQPSDSDETHLVMHDVMNDLATSVAGEFCFRLEENGTSDIPNRVRHLSYSGSQCDAPRIFESIRGANLLRTILRFDLPPDLESLQFTEKLLLQMLLAPRRLRVLCLSHYHIKNLPESFAGLKHLRYLDLSSTEIRRLPDFVCTLYNLQTLLLSNCHSLTRLPSTMGRLVSLRYLDIVGTPIAKMPLGMSKLKNLHMLSNFVMGRLSGAGLHELKDLSSLRGTLQISQLQNVAFATEANEASLKRKQYLEGLVLKWNVNVSKFYPGRHHTLACDQTEVLKMLQPHPNLKRLTIEFYGGATFPNWIGDPSFSNIMFIHLSSCNFCLSLPPLGQLPSLKDLVIEKFDRVKEVGQEFCYGENDPQVQPFQSLQTLKFYGLPRWEEWKFPKTERSLFPCLQKLSIQRCHKLKKDFKNHLPFFTKVTSDCSLTEEEISSETPLNPGSRNSVSSPEELLSPDNPNAGETVSNQTSEGDDVFPEPTLPEKTQVPADAEEISRTEDEMSSQHSELKTEISDLSYVFPDSSAQQSGMLSMQGLHSFQPPPMLGTHIPGTSGYNQYQDALTDVLSSWAPSKIRNPQHQDDETDYESFKVSEISQLMELPSGLRSLKIEKCEGLDSLPEGLMGNNPYLQELFILECNSLESFPGGHPPTTLKTLYVRDCKKLEFIHTVRTMHQYSQLEYLFIANSCNTLRSFPISFFPKLKSLSIRDCPDFISISVQDGLGEDRLALEALDIIDCPKLESFPEGGFPMPKLTSMLLSNCKKLKALPARLFRLTSLLSLFINECPEIDSVPVGGFPLSLTTLCISHCNKLTPRTEWGLYDLDNLRSLEIQGGCNDIESFPEDRLLPKTLHSLCISEFSNLKSLRSEAIQNLTSLEMVEITNCLELRDLPDEGFPSSLTYLCINDCPPLKTKLLEKEIEWYKVSHIPHLEIDGDSNL